MLKRTGRLRRMGQNSLLLLFALLISLACAEFVIHHLQGRDRPVHQTGKWLFFEFDPLLGWRKSPGGEGRHVTSEYEVVERINSKGLRGHECPYDKPAGEFRILALGDSFCEGYSVALHDHFTDRLQELLNMRDNELHYRVINGGTRGYSTDQELLFWETEGYKYNPDLVLLMFYGNDVWYNIQKVAYRRSKPVFDLQDGELILSNVPVPESVEPEPTPPPTPSRRLTARQWLDKNSIIYSSVRRRVRSIRWIEAIALKIGLAREQTKRYATIPEPFKVWQRQMPPQIRKAWEVTEALLRRLREGVEASGAKLIVFYIPNMAVVQNDTKKATELKYGFSDEAWDMAKAGDELLLRCRGLSIDCINPIDDFRAEASRLEKYTERLYYALDHHWNSNGHKLAADMLFRHIKSESSCSQR